jgi:hypothetical protein
LTFDGDALVVRLDLATPGDERLAAARQRIEAIGGEMQVVSAGGRSHVSAAIPSARPSLR